MRAAAWKGRRFPSWGDHAVRGPAAARMPGQTQCAPQRAAPLRGARLPGFSAESPMPARPTTLGMNGGVRGPTVAGTGGRRTPGRVPSGAPSPQPSLPPVTRQAPQSVLTPRGEHAGEGRLCRGGRSPTQPASARSPVRRGRGPVGVEWMSRRRADPHCGDRCRSVSIPGRPDGSGGNADVAATAGPRTPGGRCPRLGRPPPGTQGTCCAPHGGCVFHPEKLAHAQGRVIRPGLGGSVCAGVHLRAKA